MKWASLAACALGTALVLAAGCKSLNLDLGVAGPDAAGGVRIVDGSPKAVAVSLQGTLERQGLKAKIVESSDGLLVESQTVAGLRFALLLKSQPAADGHEQTHVAVVWMNGNDRGTEVQVLAEIDRPTKK